MAWYRKYSCFFIPALYLLTAFLLDVIMYSFMQLPFPTDYVYSLILMLIVAALVSFTQRKWLQIVVLSLIISAHAFVCVSNIISYVNLFEVFSIETLRSTFNALVAAGSVKMNLSFIFPLVAVIALYVAGVVAICLLCKCPHEKHRRWQPLVCVVVVVACLFSNIVAYWSLPAYQAIYIQNLDSKRFNYDTFLNRPQYLKTFGTYSFYLNNLLYKMNLKTSPTDALGIKIQENFVADTFEYDQIPQLAEGDNLIMILMETFERSAINQYTMPNLYEFMTSQCISIEGYYSIERTCFTDYVSQTGMHVLGKEMWSNYPNVAIPHSLANIFNRSGYVTAAFHDYYKQFYDRDKFFETSLGFDKIYDYYYMSEQFVPPYPFNYNKDEKLFKENLDRIAPTDKNFYSYIISVSTHALSPDVKLDEIYPDGFDRINENFEALAALYPGLTSDNPDDVQITKNYLAGTYSFDKGFGALLQHLTDHNLLDNTAIVMFGDHYMYSYPNAFNPEITDPQNLIGNQSPFIIYNPKASENPADRIHKGCTIQHFAATMDIYKTVCSMFGVVTDTQLTYGHSVLTSATSVGVGYANGYIWGRTDAGENWRTSDFVTFAPAGKTLTADEIKKYTPVVSQTFNAIIADMLIYDKNGFKDLAKLQNLQESGHYCLRKP